MAEFNNKTSNIKMMTNVKAALMQLLKYKAFLIMSILIVINIFTYQFINYYMNCGHHYNRYDKTLNNKYRNNR